ncbi:protein tyrosine phosphatase family protein [Thalassotalea sp. PS06]|uniref:protein tyrosine phosphatase family protein n=1 Tax=Thalassotalea sp. PS06 TaxID=2594005 RepID=UPI0011654F5D|nr:protein tyrosine phosphatase family protein [Thalassotalea sp. PS06]QDP01676.1 hypothetical protein FNC98_10225 [Thalassotalea sp. PS06]
MKALNLTLLVFFIFFCRVPTAFADDADLQTALSELKNYQVNNEKMVSSGLPNEAQFEVLKALGVTKVIDLIPGDRTEEQAFMAKLELIYHNIPVIWENPRLADFEQYVAVMQEQKGSEGITLTHCKLNWRGAVFTYLYRVTQLGEPDETAKRDLLAIWKPDETWQRFIDDVKQQYSVN